MVESEFFDKIFGQQGDALIPSESVEQLAAKAAAADMGGITGEEIAHNVIESITQIANDPENIRKGNEIAASILGHIDHLMYGPPEPTFGGGEMVGADPTVQIIPAHEDKTKFSAGTCYHCGGRGYTTWPSSGSRERCWYCQGSGVQL